MIKLAIPFYLYYQEHVRKRRVNQDFGTITVKQIARHIVPPTLLRESKNVTSRMDSVRTGARTIHMATRVCSLVIRIAMITEQMLPYKPTVSYSTVKPVLCYNPFK